jgi:hypothetical protein
MKGTGRNKKEAKQRSAQLCLKQLHPDVLTWGELLQLYTKNPRVIIMCDVCSMNVFKGRREGART